MAILDFEALERAPLQNDPCDFIVVPQFVKREALAEVNRDYPAIEVAGNFPPEQLDYGQAFSALLAELQSPIMRGKVAAKFGVNLDEHPLQITVRKYSEASDGNVHNDSKMKVVTVLIYFNDEWKQAGGRLRLVRTPDNIEDYAAEVAPEGGALLAFRRNEHSYHGFVPCVGERRSLQMYWVSPKRAARSEKPLTLKRRLKRWAKLRPR
jgi:Rps23 Pro-64 3,4-dihydroxylase Tpa1-like proline 4-hydroxylase